VLIVVLEEVSMSSDTCSQSLPGIILIVHNTLVCWSMRLGGKVAFIVQERTHGESLHQGDQAVAGT